MFQEGTVKIQKFKKHWEVNSQDFAKKFNAFSRLLYELILLSEDASKQLSGAKKPFENATFLLLGKSINHILSSQVLLEKGLLIGAALSTRNALETLLLLQAILLDPKEKYAEQWLNGKQFKPNWDRKRLEKVHDVTARDIVSSSSDDVNHMAYSWLSDISGIAQFQLVHIHPFLDGNGRTSRLLSTLCLYKAGYDFKRLFTISEYYDRDRPTFYKTIQSVRENDMDMTGWLDYFITGLETQMIEVKERGEQVIRRDVLTQKHNLNERQTKAIEYILQYDRLTIQDYEVLCPEVDRRSLQRDLKIMIEKELIATEGATNQLVYLLRD